MSATQNRRRFLWLALGAVAGGYALVRWPGLRESSGATPRATRWFPAGVEAAARRFGERCRRALAPADDEALWRDVEAAVGGVAALGLADAPLRQRVASRIAHELARGEVVDVDGFQLAPTEARILALAAAVAADDDV
jgi:hypothetical protein